MSVQDEINQTVEAAETKVKAEAVLEQAGMAALTVARYWHVLGQAGVAEEMRHELVMHLADLWWTHALYGALCDGHEDEG